MISCCDVRLKSNRSKNLSAILSIRPVSFILATWLQTNTLYFLSSLKVTVLSDHAYTSLILNLLRLHFKFRAKFEGMCAGISSSRDIDIFVLANWDLLVVRL